MQGNPRCRLVRFAPGRALGLDWIDRACLRALGLDPAFIAMVQTCRIDVAAIARAAWPDERHRRLPIWNRLGYCLSLERGLAS